MSILNLDALRSASLNREPFDFLVVPSFIAPDALERVNTDYPEIDRPRNYRLDELEFGAAFERFVEEYGSNHISGVAGLWVRELELLCEMLDIEPVVMDGAY